MMKQPDVTIDRKSSTHINTVHIILNRPDNPKLGVGTFEVGSELLALCYKELGITNDYGGMERMSEVVDWLCRYESKLSKQIIIKDAEIIN